MTQVENDTQTALITGANRGIGLQWCKKLLNSEFSVVATCRTPSKAEDLIKLQKTYKNKLSIEKLDVTSDDQINDLAQKLKNKPIDLLILNAGVISRKGFGSLNRKDLMNILNINTCSGLMIAQSLYNNVKISNRKQIIGISGGYGSITNLVEHSAVSYRISKTAFNMAMANVAIKSVKDKDGIHVMVICPGWVQSDMGGSNATYTPETSVNNQWKNVVNKYKTLKNGGFYNHLGIEYPW